MTVARDSGVTPEGVTEQLLELLRAEEPVESFERLLATVPEAERDAVRRSVDVALEVRGVLSERRRREAELAALYETAGDLSSLRDLEKVLQAIVRRARQLLGTDAAYLTLMDESRGDTYMRVTDGIETEAFKNVRLEMGAGLGGLVAQTATPYATPDYASDHRFVHLIDDVVAGERIVAILGVPLKLGHRVIGVLFAANRRERPFAREEVDLLLSLAAHAAIAIENASLFQETQQALRELQQANEIIQQHSEAVERAAELHERLTGLVLQGRGLPDVAHAVADVLRGALLVVDDKGRVTTAAGASTDPLWEELRSAGAVPGDSVVRRALDTAVSTGRTVRTDEVTGPGQHFVTPVVAGAEHLGALVLVRADRLDEAELRMLERAALVTALVRLNQRAIAEAEHRTRGELLDDLITAPARDADGLRRRAALLGVDLDQPHAVVVARVAATGRRAAAAAAAAHAREYGGLSGEHLGRVVVLVPDMEAGAAADSLARRLRGCGSDVTVGAAGPESGPAGLSVGYQDAARCLDVLVALGRTGQSASPRELGIYGLLFSQAGREELDRFVHRTIGPVLDYDATRGSDLVRTLTAYFDCDGNVARTAAELFIHVNTLYQRLDRVTRLLGEGWRHGDDALQVHLALKVHIITTAA
jgi:GAF domain-containing protein